MDAATAKELAKKLHISIDYIIREEYEMRLLKEIYESKFAGQLIFKGGTALRLAYGSPRFSEDLDFTALGNLPSKDLVKWVKELPTRVPGIVEVEAIKKFYTVFGLVKIKDVNLPHLFSIKIEVSKRKGAWVADKDYSDKLIASDMAVWRVIARVASLERILIEKKDALANRKAPRDIFDWWFIHQSLQRSVTPDITGYNKKQVKAELRRLLPKPQWRLINLWLA